MIVWKTKWFLWVWLLIVSSALGQQPEGDLRQVHDPSIIKGGDTYYVFSTRAGIAVRCSNDLIHWRLCGDVFAHLPRSTRPPSLRAIPCFNPVAVLSPQSGCRIAAGL